jgi:hypothetical protein
MPLADCMGAIGAFLNLPEGSKGTMTTEGKLVSLAMQTQLNL